MAPLVAEVQPHDAPDDVPPRRPARRILAGRDAELVVRLAAAQPRAFAVAERLAAGMEVEAQVALELIEVLAEDVLDLVAQVQIGLMAGDQLVAAQQLALRAVAGGQPSRCVPSASVPSVAGRGWAGA